VTVMNEVVDMQLSTVYFTLKILNVHLGLIGFIHYMYYWLTVSVCHIALKGFLAWLHFVKVE